MKVWQCRVCKYIHRGDTPPEKCPICGVPASKFVEIDEASIPEKMPKRKKPERKELGTKDEGQTPVPAIKKTGFEKIKSLLVKHHAHPVLVHTPNGILPIAVILWLTAWIFDYDLLSKVAFINLIFVIIALPLVIFTGILEWKKKFNGTMTMIFKLKILTAALTTVSCVINFVWYLLDPKILSSPKAWIFLCINILMLIAAGIAGHIGGKLVYKD
ncbi:MAG: rubredoxin [Desulfobacula sp.]|uniref:rubredoxin-like domain-containing protein n=1 Tax=Desulfobacula sp. TaxID=2593537 RepID=UPI00345B5891|nr:rubredoxin [Desulfobacula sp.]